MKTYEVLKPIGYGGRQEKGAILELPEDVASAFGSEYVRESNKEATVVAKGEKEETPLKGMKLAELRKKAKELGLDESGTKPDLIDRITLHIDEEAGE